MKSLLKLLFFHRGMEPGQGSSPTLEPVAVGFRCSHCNQPLPLRRTGILACPACGGENYVELPAAVAARPRPDRLPVVVLLGVLGVIVVSMAGAVLVAVWAFQHRRHAALIDDDPAGARARSPTRCERGHVAPIDDDQAEAPRDPPDPRRPSPAPRAAELVSWGGNNNWAAPCLDDVDADGAPDLVGVGDTGGRQKLMAVSAVSGRILWQSGEFGKLVDLWCDGRGGGVLLNSDDFSVIGIDVKSGRRLWSTRLRDEPNAVAFGDRCLRALAIDKSVTSLALATGTPSACPSASAPRPRSKTAREPLTAKGLTFAFSHVTPGSPRIIVKASRGAHVAWSRTLAIASDSHSTPPHVLQAPALLVAGEKPGTREKVVVMLDVETGAVLAARDIHQTERRFHSGTFFMELAATERHVFLESYGQLYALRMPALDVAWETGGD
jgi:hypothetical protein